MNENENPEDFNEVSGGMYVAEGESTELNKQASPKRADGIVLDPATTDDPIYEVNDSIQ